MDKKERFILNDDFVAALYDRRFYTKGLSKKKFKDVYRAGHIIDKLYGSSKGDEKISNHVNHLGWFNPREALYSQ